MPLLHLSINATDPQRVASILASFLGGKAMPFPPFPGSWIAFAEQDDGTAIEVYPTTHRLRPGRDQIECVEEAASDSPGFLHVAIASNLPALEVIELAMAQGWLARKCSRGPFELIEVWLENRLLVEVLDPAMQADYRRGMTMANWVSMFGLDEPG